jgi:ferredoxin
LLQATIETKKVDGFSIFIYVCTLFNKNKIIKSMAYRISEDCTACGTCIDECPVGAISPGDIYSIDPEICSECGTCADACPMGAIHPE